MILKIAILILDIYMSDNLLRKGPESFVQHDAFLTPV